MGLISLKERKTELFRIEGKCESPIDYYLQSAVDLDYGIFIINLIKFGQIDLYLSESNLYMLKACIAHWLIIVRINKNKKKKYKHPWGKDAEIFKPHAEVYASVWDAISDLMDIKCFLPESVKQYSCTAEWFCCILYEFSLISLSPNTKGKKDALSQIQARNNALTCIKNGRKIQLLRTKQNSPKAFDHLAKLWSRERCPHTYELFLTLLEHNPDGFDTVLKALKSFATYFDVDIPANNIVFSNEHEDFQTQGRGSKRVVHKPKLLDLETLAIQAF